MPTLTIESNGRLEKTAVYYNGQQLGGINELFLNLDEDGTFDAVIQYEGTDKETHTRQIFEGYLANVKVTEPSFTEEEAMELHRITIESDGDIDSTMLFENDEPLEGVISLLIHIKAVKSRNGIKSLFGGKKLEGEHEFRAEITFRNEDDTIETENIF